MTQSGMFEESLFQRRRIFRFVILQLALQRISPHKPLIFNKILHVKYVLVSRLSANSRL